MAGVLRRGLATVVAFVAMAAATQMIAARPAAAADPTGDLGGIVAGCGFVWVVPDTTRLGIGDRPFTLWINGVEKWTNYLVSGSEWPDRHPARDGDVFKLKASSVATYELVYHRPAVCGRDIRITYSPVTTCPAFVDTDVFNADSTPVTFGFDTAFFGDRHSVTIAAGQHHTFHDVFLDNTHAFAYTDTGMIAFADPSVPNSKCGQLRTTLTPLCGQARIDVTNPASGSQRVALLRNPHTIPPDDGIVWQTELPSHASETALTPAEAGDHFYVQGGFYKEIVAGMDYDTPTACASPAQATATFSDTCTATKVTLTNLGPRRDFTVTPAGGDPKTVALAPGDRTTVTITVSDGRLVTVSTQDAESFATHPHHQSASCDNGDGGLPVTGTRTGPIALVGLLLLLAGTAITVLTRRRQRPRSAITD